MYIKRAKALLVLRAMTLCYKIKALDIVQGSTNNNMK
jgi:hypothetical protein